MIRSETSRPSLENRPAEFATVKNMAGCLSTSLYAQGDSDVISMPSGFRRHLVGKTHINVFHIPYQLRNRFHNITLINKTKLLNDTDFIIRMLYKYSY